MESVGLLKSIFFKREKIFYIQDFLDLLIK